MPPNCPQSLQPSWAVQLSLVHHGAPVLESFNLCSLVHHVSIVVCIVLQWETIVWKQDETSTRLVPREQWLKWLIASLQVTFIPCQELQVNEGFGRKVPESAPFSAPYADQTTEDGNQTFGWPPNWVCRSKQTHCNSVKRRVVATCKWDQMSVSYVSDTLSRDVTWFGVSNTHKHIETLFQRSQPDRPPAASGDHYPMCSPQIWVAFVGLHGSLWQNGLILCVSCLQPNCISISSAEASQRSGSLSPKSPDKSDGSPKEALDITETAEICGTEQAGILGHVTATCRSHCMHLYVEIL